MKQPDLKHAVYRTLYPYPVEGDPTNFSEFVNLCIVPEVRTETVRFYGPIDDLEAKYPGLDYSKPAHRLRLRHFPEHCRLFDAFDKLQLTGSEIYDLCKWEGTKHAKDKYMRNNNIDIHDTTFDGVKKDNRPRLSPTSYRSVYHRPRWQISSTLEARPMELDGAYDAVGGGFSFSLNQRLRAATAERLRQQPLPLDPAYEQWLKDTSDQQNWGYFSEIQPFSESSFTQTPPLPLYVPIAPSTTNPRIAPSYGRHRRQWTLPVSSYEPSHYWTRTVPEMVQYAPRIAPASGRWGYRTDTHFSPRHMPQPPLVAPTSSPSNHRLYHAPGWTGTPPTELRRSRRR